MDAIDACAGPPAWVRDAVFYQVFPDRFANGDKGNDPPGTRRWGDRPSRGTFFGGDLAGIIEKIPYVASLGVNALYLTPVFKGDTTHKYDTVSYLEIDPCFGDLATFRRMVRALHDAGIRVVLDGVFNHTGFGFWAFQDIVRNGRASRFWDWYTVDSLPVKKVPRPNYETFGIWYLPRLATANPAVQAHLLEVADFWTREGIDGWRLDVADRVNPQFWKLFRRKVRSVNPEAYIVGEIWCDASPWLAEGLFDSVMNYTLRDAILKFLVRGEVSAAEFGESVAGQLERYPEGANYAAMNLLGSHDTTRILTLCRGNRQKLSQALAVLFTLVGAPMVYYGDEVGMRGRNDPDCRRPMEWDESKWDRGILDLVRRLVSLRRESEALRRGSFKLLAPQEGSGAPDGGVDADLASSRSCSRVIAYARATAREWVVVVLNASDRAAGTVRVPLSGIPPAGARWGPGALRPSTLLPASESRRSQLDGFRGVAPDGCLVVENLGPRAIAVLRTEGA